MRLLSLCLLVSGGMLIAGSMGCGGASKTVSDAGMDLGTQLMGSFTDAGNILGSITDEASAQAATPKIEQVNADLDDLAAKAEEASPETKASLSEIATAQIPGLQELTDKAYAIPGVKPVVQPPLDSMFAKFAQFQ